MPYPSAKVPASSTTNEVIGGPVTDVIVVVAVAPKVNVNELLLVRPIVASSPSSVERILLIIILPSPSSLLAVAKTHDRHSMV